MKMKMMMKMFAVIAVLFSLDVTNAYTDTDGVEARSIKEKENEALASRVEDLKLQALNEKLEALMNDEDDNEADVRASPHTRSQSTEIAAVLSHRRPPET